MHLAFSPPGGPPFISTLPLVCSSTPAKIRNIVDFPQPLGPTTAKISFFRTENERSRKARTPGPSLFHIFVRPSQQTISSGVADAGATIWLARGLSNVDLTLPPQHVTLQ